ncbi:adenylosuccinate lyase [Robiginitalea biformata]|uniref:adenylosuccinate lyase n=1 Tax=Robiginitalea biformata TaxID=252307 RepID=UPI003B5B35A7
MELNNQLLQRLDYVDATRKERLAMAAEILGTPHWLPDLIAICLNRHDAIGSRACWVLEFVFKKDPARLFPYLGVFIDGLSRLQEESSIRPMAKICELLAGSYYKPGKGAKPPLESRHRERMAEVCFDWLIGPHKVAPKAYCMQTLYLLGEEFPWIRPELREVLKLNYAKGSAAYQARARHVLKLLKKSQ